MAAVEPHVQQAVPALQDPLTVRPEPGRHLQTRPRRQVVTLGVACAVPSLVAVAVGSAAPFVGRPDGARALAVLQLVLTLAAAVPALWLGARALRAGGMQRRGPAVLAAAALVALGLAATHGLALVLPFRPGLLSVLVFAVPPFALAAGAALRSRTALLAAGGTVLALFALAVPLRGLQQQVGLQDLLLGTGVPSRSLLQPVLSADVERTGVGSDGHRAVFTFTDPQDRDTGGLSDGFDKAAVETVRPGYGDPCATPVARSDGERLTAAAPLAPCVPQPGGLWCDAANRCVLQRDGLTLTLAVAPELSTLDGGRQVPAALRATHPASDAELRSLEGWLPSSWLGRLLL
ncbi:hypothetical protein ACFW1A_24880 [Kitasatospora sp. NPDC058965]|uniref:hypothetical protein n=1 Tax=Kitasatospora sp. NPDC058965 TaxID=3346682 RepID=UPI00368FEDCC